MASGNGSSIESIITKINQNSLTGYNPKVIICNKPKEKAGIYKRAERLNIPIFYAPEPKEQIEIFKEYETQLILSLGYTKIIKESLLKEYENKVINIHPTLLPKYGGKGMYGLETHLSVLKSKDEYTGVTIHLVNPEFDKGKVLKQIKIPVPNHLIGKPTENNAKELQQYVLKKEYKLMQETLEKIKDKNILI